MSGKQGEYRERFADVTLEDVLLYEAEQGFERLEAERKRKRLNEAADKAAEIMRDWSCITPMAVGGMLVDIYMPPLDQERLDFEVVRGLTTLLNKVFVMPNDSGTGACKVFETDNALGIAVLHEARWKW